VCHVSWCAATVKDAIANLKKATEGIDIDAKTARAAASLLRVTTKAWLEGDPLDLQYLARLLPVGDVQVRQDGDRFYLAGAELDSPRPASSSMTWPSD